jgi:hypothetical protein
MPAQTIKKELSLLKLYDQFITDNQKGKRLLPTMATPGSCCTLFLRQKILTCV